MPKEAPSRTQRRSPSAARGRLAFVVAALLACGADGRAEESVRITTTDGRTIAGVLRSGRTGRMLIVRSGGRDVYVSSAIVKEIGDGASTQPADKPADKAQGAPPQPDLSPQMRQAADELARATGAFFAGRRVDAAPALAKQYTDSPLPMAVKVAILREAPAPRAGPPPANGRIGYRHHETGEQFHYFLTLPPNYDPNRPTPAMICLHGMSSKAGVMSRFWGRAAAANGLILIDPEYVYGRPKGYLYTEQEHHAVLGALWDAAGRCNIDADRVFLQGHSQGGHACWDIGAAHAGRFAGVIPVIGAPIFTNQLPNYADTALYAVDGSLDMNAPRMNQQALRMLAGLGCDATYVEYVGRGHEGFLEENARIARWILAHRRPAAPKRVNLIALRPCDFRRRWVEVQAAIGPLGLRKVGGVLLVSPPPPAATVSASIRNNVFVVRTRNVARMRLLLPPELIDFSRKVGVQLNGRYTPTHTVKPDWRFALEDAFTRRDRRDVFLGAIELKLR